MRPSVLTRKPVPWATGCPPLSDVMIETMAPFAALAIVGMSFRGGADCAATTPARSKIKGKATEEKAMAACFTPAFLLYQSWPGTALESMELVEAVIRTRRSE